MKTMKDVLLERYEAQAKAERLRKEIERHQAWREEQKRTCARPPAKKGRPRRSFGSTPPTPVEAIYTEQRQAVGFDPMLDPRLTREQLQILRRAATYIELRGATAESLTDLAATLEETAESQSLEDYSYMILKAAYAREAAEVLTQLAGTGEPKC